MLSKVKIQIALIFLFGVFFSIIKNIPIIQSNYLNSYPFLEADSFYFMNQAKEILSNKMNFIYNDFFYFDLYGVLIAFLSFLTPFSIETISFYSPAIISSLIVIPFYLIFKELGDYRIGLLAAFLLIGSTFYWSRTQVGFSDSDSGILFFLFLFIFFLIKKNFNTYWLILSILLFQWWYVNAIIISIPILFIWAIYQYLNKKAFVKKLTISLISFAPIFILYKIPIILIFIYLYSFRKKYISYFLLIASIFISLYSFFIKIWIKINYYLFNFNNKINDKDFSLRNELLPDSRYINENQTIELSSVCNTIFYENCFLFTLSIIGFYFLYKFSKKLFFVLMPVLFLGLSALFLGNRFFLYLEPILSISLSVFIIYFSNKIRNRKKEYFFIFFIIFLFLTHDNYTRESKVDLVTGDTIFKKINSLKHNISEHIKENSFIITPTWEQGHTISFYTNSYTARNGAIHSSLMNFYFSTQFLSENEELIVANFINYFNKFKKSIELKESPFVMNDFIEKEIFNDKLKPTYYSHDIYILLPIDLKHKHIERNLELKSVKEKPIYNFYSGYLKSNYNSNFLSYDINKNKLNTIFLKNKVELDKVIIDNKLIYSNKDNKFNLNINGKLITLYDKKIEDTFIIKLYTNKLKYFDLIFEDDTYRLFKLNKNKISFKGEKND